MCMANKGAISTPGGFDMVVDDDGCGGGCMVEDGREDEFFRCGSDEFEFSGLD